MGVVVPGGRQLGGRVWRGGRDTPAAIKRLTSSSMTVLELLRMQYPASCEACRALCTPPTACSQVQVVTSSDATSSGQSAAPTNVEQCNARACR